MEGFERGSVKKPVDKMTNLEFFEVFCEWCLDDMRVIQRMANAAFEKAGLTDRPLWEREQYFEHWLREPFDEVSWRRARLNYSQIHLAIGA